MSSSVPSCSKNNCDELVTSNTKSNKTSKFCQKHYDAMANKQIKKRARNKINHKTNTPPAIKKIKLNTGKSFIVCYYE